MLALLSPSKTMDFESDKKLSKAEHPELFNESLKLVKILKDYSKNDIKKLMDLSEKLAELNYSRFQKFSEKMDKSNARQAIFAFKGDVYEGLDSDNLNDKEIKIANGKIAILSGLYGVIRPLNYIQPYRLEMGTKLQNPEGENLYDFWKNKISSELNNLEDELIINLASNEYFKAIDKKKIKAKIIDINFKEDKNGKVKIIAIYAKKARGLMARYIVKNNIEELQDLRNFDYAGYKFSKDLSDDKQLTFVRKHN